MENLKKEKTFKYSETNNYRKECGKKWSQLKDKEKSNYLIQNEIEKIKYKNDLLFVKHYIFRYYNDNLQRAPTAYNIYLNVKFVEGIEKYYDPKYIRKEASNNWKKMSYDEKRLYYERKIENDNWFEKATKIKKVTPISIFIQKIVEESKEKNCEIPTIKDFVILWEKYLYLIKGNLKIMQK